MDEFGDIIYLLIVVGAVISGLIKKVRKAKPEANPRPVAEEPKQDWRDIFEQMIPEEQKPQPVYQAPQPAPNPKYQGYETATNYDDLRVKNRFASAEVEEEINEEIVDVASEISLATTSDARTAFVYAEILTRKY